MRNHRFLLKLLLKFGEGEAERHPQSHPDWSGHRRSLYKWSRLEIFKTDQRNFWLEITAFSRSHEDLVKLKQTGVLSPLLIGLVFKNDLDWNFSRRMLDTKRRSLLAELVGSNPLTLQPSSLGCHRAHHHQREHKRPWCRKPCAAQRS